MNQKVTIVGAGNVGAATAQKLAERELCDVVLIDVIDGLPQGKSLDLAQAAPIDMYDAHLSGAASYDVSANSDIVVVTAGISRKPGMSRNDLLSINRNIVKNVVREITAYSRGAVLIIVTNPLDAMCHVALDQSGFPKERVVGMAGILDSARFRTFISMELDVSVENVQALVLGGHGDAMVPLPRFSTVAGLPITELMPPDRIEALAERTRNAGGEIVNLLKTGSAYYAPSSAIVEMAESILKDKKKILPCSAYLEGEYGIDGLFVGVPVKLGRNGIEQIISVRLTADEQKALMKSAAAVRELVDVMKGMP